MRSDYKNAWFYLEKAKEAISSKQSHAKVLEDLQTQLEQVCPAPKTVVNLQ
jgi:hypothetical protein